jgi:hypothetical protein
MASVYYLVFVYMYLIWRSHRLLTLGVLDEDMLLGCSACLFPYLQNWFSVYVAALT